MSKKKFSECPIVVTVVDGNPIRGYYCRFPEWSNCCWANFYLDTAMGTLTVSSDWGDYSHRWGRSGNASYKTFDEFIASCDSSYITTKFSYDRREEFNVFKVAETVNDLRKEVVEARQRDELTEAEARILYNYCIYLTGFENDRDFYEALHEKVDYVDIESHHAYDYDDCENMSSSKFYEHLGIEPSEGWLQYGYTGRVNFLQDELLPSFLKWLNTYWLGVRNDEK